MNSRDLLFDNITDVLNKMYDKKKVAKPSGNPNTYQRGFEDGWNKGYLAALKDAEDKLLEEI